VMNMNEPPSLLRNDLKGGGNWLKVLLRGTKSNRSAIGSRVTVRYGTRVQCQEVLAQCSFYSVNDRRLHFGLGTESKAEITVRWASGGSETVKDVPAGHLIEIREGSGIVKRTPFGGAQAPPG